MGEVVLPFRTPNPRPVTEARSTLIISAIQTMRAQGLYDRYVELISPEFRQEMMSLVAGLWVPCELALEHYRTMDRLGLSRSTIEAIGAEVAERGSKTVLGRGAGLLRRRDDVTPWMMLMGSHRTLDINWKGSDFMVTKEGPQDAIVIWGGQPCASVPYFVISWGGFMKTLAGQFCTKVVHRIVNERCTPTTIVMSLSWI
jgi:hypothetical protein